MRFLRATGLYGIANFLLFCGLAVGQETLNGVPAELVFYPDTIVYNAKLVTMDDASVGINTPVGTITEAMAVRDARSWPWEPMRRFSGWPDRRRNGSI